MSEVVVLAERRRSVPAADVTRRRAGLDDVCGRLGRRWCGRDAVRVGLAVGLLIGGGRALEFSTDGRVWLDGELVGLEVLSAVSDRLSEVVHVPA